MKFRYTSNFYPVPFEPEHFINGGHVDITDWTEGGEEHILGRVAIDCLNVNRVMDERQGPHLFDVCDADSQGWHDVFSSLFDVETCELMPEVDSDMIFDNILLIHRMYLHPVLQPWEASIVYHMARLQGLTSILVMLSGATSLPTKALVELGFSKLANCEFLYLPAMRSKLPKEDPPFPPLLELDEAIDYTSDVLENWSEDDFDDEDF